MAKESDSQRKGRRRRLIERSPRLVFALAIALIVLPPIFMGLAGSWGLAALEREPERYYERAAEVANRLVQRLHGVLPKSDEAIPGVAPNSNPTASGSGPSMRTVTLEDAYANQVAAISSQSSVASAVLTFQGTASAEGEEVLPPGTTPLVKVPGAALLHITSPYPRDDLRDLSRVTELVESFAAIRRSNATHGYHGVMMRTREAGSDRLFLIQSYSHLDWSDPQTVWIAWELDLAKLNGLLSTWAGEEHELVDDLPADFRVLHWSAPEPETQGVRYLVPLRLGNDSLPFWKLSITVDLEELPAGGIQWRSLFYAIFAVVTVPGAFLLGVFLYSRLRQEVAEARNKVDFVANVTHELRTPLTSIRMFAETLLAGRIRSEEDRREALEVIHQETGRLGRLIDRVLEFNKLERQTKIFNFEPNDIGEIVTSTVKLFEGGEKSRHPEIRIIIEPGIPMVECDRDAIREVILNLLSNAEKYAGVTLPVVVSVALQGKYVHIDVTDQGPGIPLGEQAKIFEKFYRAGDTLNRKVEGTGLGLAICRAILRAHRGSISVTSAPGKGTTFHAKIPIRHEAAAMSSGRFTSVGRARP